MKTPPPTPRVDFPQAIVDVLEALKNIPATSISGLAKATGIDRRTVAKAIDLIMKVQDSLATTKINRRKEGKMWVISMTNRTIEFFQNAISRIKRRNAKD
jgi:predicted regulator of amino acid metabolism with ACT domain